ncbi:MAG: Gfo/Idh/MocA family oxidoreductase [Planctomycetota bacterium]
MLKVGIVGVGYWGPNLVRNFNSLTNCQVEMICDLDPSNLGNILKLYPEVKTTENFDELIDSGVNAIVIATPTATHFGLAKKALMKGIHVFVEKPLTVESDESQELIELAESRGLTLFVGHIFLHSAPVKKLRELIASGELGNIHYISCKRLNLGPVRSDVSSLYDLATHDISIVLHLLGVQPMSVSCQGLDHLKKGIHDVVNLTMNFPGNRMGMVHCSWLDPRKERLITVVGDKKMAIYDDLSQEKIRVYDKGVNKHSKSGDLADFQLSYRHGDMYSPWIDQQEPLRTECSDFIECIRTSQTPKTDGQNGLAVVEVLEAANESLQLAGAPVAIESRIVV